MDYIIFSIRVVPKADCALATLYYILFPGKRRQKQNKTNKKIKNKLTKKQTKNLVMKSGGKEWYVP